MSPLKKPPAKRNSPATLAKLPLPMKVNPWSLAAFVLASIADRSILVALCGAEVDDVVWCSECAFVECGKHKLVHAQAAARLVGAGAADQGVVTVVAEKLVVAGQA